MIDLTLYCRRKNYLQKTWAHRDAKGNSLNWDDPLPTELEEMFASWTNQLEKTSCAEYPRYLCPGVNSTPKPDEIYLHTFFDVGDNCF